MSSCCAFVYGCFFALKAKKVSIEQRIATVLVLCALGCALVCDFFFLREAHCHSPLAVLLSANFSLLCKVHIVETLLESLGGLVRISFCEARILAEEC